MDKVQQTNHFEDKSEMVREEEIITASHNEKNYPCCIISDKTSHPIIFQIGAKWADQHPRKGLWDAEKVCKWLNDKIAQVELSSDLENLDIYYSYCMVRKDTANAIIRDLRKAMED